LHVDTLRIALHDELGGALDVVPLVVSGADVPAGGRAALVVPANELGNALLRRAVDGRVTELRMGGVMRAGAGTLAREDGVAVRAALVAPLRFRLPSTGLSLERRVHLDIDALAARTLGSVD